MKRYLLIALLFISCQAEPIEQIPIENNVKIWTDGIIPFAFTNNVPQEQKEIILKAMNTYEHFFKIDYVQYSVEDLLDLEKGFLIKYSGSVNNSVYPIGMPDYISEWRVSDLKYFNHSVALHELGHNLGREHEQQLADALEHLIIDYSNLNADWKGNFEIGNTRFLTPFDYSSNMIYGSYDAAIDPSKPVMTDLKGNTFEPSDNLTDLDKQKYIELYGIN